MFRVTMLPAGVGDSLWIEYGPEAAPRRILIDGGTSPTYRRHLEQRLRALGPKARFELLVVTHVDTDHIGGVLPMLAAGLRGIEFREVWFNAWRHLEPASLEEGDILGPIDGEILTQQLVQLGLPWNRSFRTSDGAARTALRGRLGTRVLPGDLRLTLVAPTRTELDILKPKWQEVVEGAGLVPGVPSQTLSDKARQKGVVLDLLGDDPIRDWADYDPRDLDDTEANGSSIAMLAEYDDDGVSKRCLLAGDAHGPVLLDGVRRLAAQLGEERLRVDAFKLPHHGSVRNVTRDLLKAVDARRYLFSTDSGGRHGHPHKEAVARVLLDAAKPTSLKFNYRTGVNELWDNTRWIDKYDYDVEYGDGTLTVSL